MTISEHEELVSIIMPAYNCEKFIGESIESIINQTYKNWELIIVDDCSTDNTPIVVKKYLEQDSRINYIRLNKNSGAAVARNKAIDVAKGKFVAFLDSDDIWFPEKLTKQINFMKENNYYFTCTSYTKIDEYGNYLDRIVLVREKYNYNDLLKYGTGNLSVVYNAEVLGKFIIPDIRKRNDYVLWLQVIKKAGFLYGIKEPLGSHRIRKDSISSRKTSLVFYHWKVYREIEHLSFFKSISLIFFWIIKSIIRK